MVELAGKRKLISARPESGTVDEALGDYMQEVAIAGTLQQGSRSSSGPVSSQCISSASRSFSRNASW